MKKRILAGLLSAAMVVTLLPVSAVIAAPEDSNDSQSQVSVLADAENPGVNIATRATANASYTNVWSITPASMNDGELATDVSYTSWNSWGTNDEAYPVTTSLTWDAPQVISGMRVMWWADNAELTSNANVTFPKSCEVYYVDAEGNEQKITGMTNESGQATDQVGVVYDSSSNNGINGNNHYWNYVQFAEPITTSELRLKIQRSGSGTNGVGISEWEVFGYTPVATGENIASAAEVTASYTNTTLPEGAASAMTDGQLAEGSNTTWNTWAQDGNVEYPVTVDLDWGDAEYEVSSLRVMWWRDYGGVMPPSDCSLQYYNSRSREWTDITDLIDETGDGCFFRRREVWN